jgi:DNA repair protein RadA/Sms
MAQTKSKTVFLCQECGATTPKWEGRCGECRTWNSLAEYKEPAPAPDDGRGRYVSADGDAPVPLTEVAKSATARISTSIGELDRVLGGGIVPGSATLIGGDPGIGKSTLMLQISAAVAAAAGPVLYVSGEESFAQTKLRAERLGTVSPDVYLLAETDLDRISSQVDDGHSLIIVDSIQSMHTARVSGAPGTISQVRESGAELVRLAKGRNVPVALIGHVTKEGSIAGPRILEHLVDTVLYFEGEGRQDLRILRAVKNRFGSTNEIGVFEMTDRGLAEVSSPSELFLTERTDGVAGSVVLAAIEGTRPVLVEVQALVTRSGYGTPRRSVTGINPNRVSLVLATLEKRASLPLYDQDVFVNVTGGLRIDEPAADLAVALAVASSFLDRPLGDRTMVFGEIGLGGEIRAAAQARTRTAEACRLGYRRCIVPQGCARDIAETGAEAVLVDNVSAALTAGLGTGTDGADKTKS